MFPTSAGQIISSFIVFIIGLIVIWSVRKYFKSSLVRASILYIWHTIFCIGYYIYVQQDAGDAISYYRKAMSYGWDNEFGFGTSGVVWLTTVLVQIFNLSFLGTFLVFNIFGALGLLAFDSTLRQTVQLKSLRLRRLATFIVILPSVSFWSSAIGKDSISFMATTFVLWAALNFKKHLILFIFSVCAMLLVRPHIAGIMLIAFTLAFLFDKKASIVQRFSIGGLAIVATSIAIPFALQYAGLNETQGVSDVESYIEERQGYNLQGGGGIDIASMSLPMQMFTYLFRPLLFEANTIFALAASIDNIILLYLFTAGGIALIKKSKPSIESNRVFLWVYATITLIILSMTTANLGIALRQKWMFVPIFVFLLMSIIETKYIKNKEI